MVPLGAMMALAAKSPEVMGNESHRRMIQAQILAFITANILDDDAYLEEDTASGLFAAAVRWLDVEDQVNLNTRLRQ